MSVAVHRSQVLSLYRRIMRMAMSWTSASGLSEETQQEQKYIYSEAGRLFRKNKQESDEGKIREYIKEAETRIGLAEHYGTPYPRMMNIPQNVLAPHGVSKLKKAQRRAIKQATPIYLKSLGEENIPDR
ncbi:LYR motif-containing protein 1 [Aplysia californica]|uniref:LYR motif-containing protein 1 n=1 Tax=Aplysia californica TaxID=6500 RepID=A0ABM0JG88_APLCA|nr:LYR motif-containing protein 1 [Aplysia californica]